MDGLMVYYYATLFFFCSHIDLTHRVDGIEGCYLVPVCNYINKRVSEISKELDPCFVLNVCEILCLVQ
jgi:hypothetical protein